MGDIKRLQRGRKPSKLFSPSIVRGQGLGSAIEIPTVLSMLPSTNIESTSSFRYDNPGVGLKSTQELSVDWSRFENHTFFNSAASKVNVAFNRIINHYPFDGTQKQFEEFEDSLTGFEKYILDRFPKNTGFLLFSGTAVGETPASGYAANLGTYISVPDCAGSLFPAFSRNKTGEAVMSPGSNSISFEMQLFIPTESNDNQIICQQKKDINNGITLGISRSLDTNNCDLIFSVTSGSAVLFASGGIEKGKWSHICATFNRGVANNNLQLFLSSSLIASSSKTFEMRELKFPQVDFQIGTGSSTTIPQGSIAGTQTQFVPKQTFSGSLDEFRFFHGIRDIFQLKSEGSKSIFATPSLKLYFKFNEPEGQYGGIEHVILDSSGNSLHSIVKNFSLSLRQTGSMTSPSLYELKDQSPILFPNYSKIGNLNESFLSSGSYYDSQNPNLITKLIPVHYLLEGQVSEGLSTQDGEIASTYKGSSMPGTGKLGTAQLFTAFLLIWAKFFDEIKLFSDYFKNLLNADYDEFESIPDKFLPFLAEYYGFNLPSLYSNTSLDQFSYGENISANYSRSTHSLTYVQNQIWRRILVNIRDIIQSKGTHHSIKSLIRSAGIIPENIFTIREYGGPTKKSLEGRRQSKTEVSAMIDMSGSLSQSLAPTINAQGVGNIVPFLQSAFLSGSRVEVGEPRIGGAFVQKDTFYPHGISNSRNDGLFTSGSFMFEGIYSFPSDKKYPSKQSLARLNVTGTSSPSTYQGTLANLMVVSGTHTSISSSGSTLKLYLRPSSQSTSEKTHLLSLENVDIFDGNVWHVSFGRFRNDTIGQISSSSYFLRCGRSSFGEIKDIFQTSSYFQEVSNNTESSNVFQNVGAFNTSGSFLTIGSQSMGGSGAGYFLNDVSVASDARETKFGGKVARLRFWSKGFEESNWREHVRNFKSTGVKNPLINFNFDTISTGSFDRLRCDASIDQVITKSDAAGNIHLIDFSQNKLFISGSGFENTKEIIKPHQFYFSMLSPKFDMSQADNKIRIRSFKNSKYLDDYAYASLTPLYEVPESETPDDDTRFSIDFSSVRALDEDMMTMFSSLDFFDDALGTPNTIFDEFYPDIDQLRKIYFNRLTDKLNIQQFFEIFKWFDTAFTDLIEQLIPKKTKFLGVNFIIESHVLERPRFRYLFDEIYLKSIERNTDKGNLSLSIIDGTLAKW